MFTQEDRVQRAKSIATRLADASAHLYMDYGEGPMGAPSTVVAENMAPGHDPAELKDLATAFYKLARHGSDDDLLAMLIRFNTATGILKQVADIR